MFTYAGYTFKMFINTKKSVKLDSSVSKRSSIWSSPIAQGVMDPVLSLLRLGFDPWQENFPKGLLALASCWCVLKEKDDFTSALAVMSSAHAY